MNHYDRFWQAWLDGHLTKLEATDLAVFYFSLAEAEYGWRWERFKRVTGLGELVT